MAAEQDYQHDDDDNEPDQPVTAAAIIAAVIAPIAATAAEQKDENDNKKEETHFFNPIGLNQSLHREFASNIPSSLRLNIFCLIILQLSES